LPSRCLRYLGQNRPFFVPVSSMRIVHVGGEPFGSRYALQHDVASQPDVVLSSATSTTEALLQQTRTIPHHFRNRRRSGRQRPCCEPAAAGQPTPQVLLISRARTGKWLELLPYAEIYLGPLGAAAAALAVEAIATSVGDTSELESAVGGFMVIPDRSLHVQPERTDHFADCPSPPSSDLAVSFLR
jgi:hypothetical protein